MTNLIASDTQGQEITSGLVELFELTTSEGTFYFHPGLKEDFTSIQFRDRISPTNPVTAGSFIIGNTYTIATVGNTTFTAIGAGNDNIGTSFVATGAGSGTGTANQTDNSIRTYTAIPMILDGVEISSAGAPNRPSLTIANVTSDLKTAVGITDYDELSGATLVRRQTLEKYLVGGSDPDQSNPPIELNTVKYKIDRISSLTNITATFELSVVYDLEGIQLPRRVVVGKFCSWMYQGHELKSSGGCIWDKDGDFQTVDASDSSVTHKLFFDLDDTPLILISLFQSVTSTWSTGQSYTQSSYVYLTKGSPVTPGNGMVIGKTYVVTTLGNNFVSYGASSNNVGTIFIATSAGTNGYTGAVTEIDLYRCEIAHTSANETKPDQNTGHWLKVRPYTAYSSSIPYSKGALVQATTTHFGKSIETVWKALASNTGKAPAVGSSYWQREELCGKKLSSCKCRFQARMVNNNAPSVPQSSKDTSGTLPFGAFPGTSRF